MLARSPAPDQALDVNAPSGQRGSQMTEANENPSDSSPGPSILAPPRNCWAVARAEQAGLLVDAAAYYRAFYEAALGARRYILMSGWQFDSTVDLLRAENTAIAEAASAPIALLPFLNYLCETRP